VTRLSSSGLRGRLLLLVLVAVVPALGLTLYTDLEQRRLETARVQDNALRLARLASADHERLVDGTRQLLVALAQLPEARGGEPAACNALFADLLKQYRSYASLGVIAPDGFISCSAPPADGAVFVGDRAYFRRALEPGDFAVGEHQIGRLTGKATVNFGYPILGGVGEVQGVVFAALDLAWLNQYAAHARLPAGATLTVIDRNATILVRYPEPERWVGQPAQDAPIVRTILAKRGEGTAEAPGLDGVPRLYAYTPLGGASGGGEVYVTVGIPTDVAFADANRTLARNLAALGLVGLLTLAAAWVGADLFVLRQIRTLVGATRRLSAGDLSARTGLPHGPGEVSQLARAFDEMAESLERAERRRLLEEELRRKNFELEQQNLSIQEASRLKTEFVSMVTHELRTPLTSIQGYVHLLHEGEAGELSEEQRELLEIVRNNAERLLALINELLDLSRIEAGRIELDLKTLDLPPLIRGVARSLRPLVDAKGQQLTVDVAEPLPAVRADADRVTQILTNLVSNAHKYTPAGGRISVAARGEDGRVRVDVTDTGIGLAPDEQAQLFTRFFRARNAATRQVGGTGLGLAIARSLVEMHGGEIAVKSAPGEGSTFSVTLPSVGEIEDTRGPDGPLGRSPARRRPP
jgi:signal transduction histidine kinase